MNHRARKELAPPKRHDYFADGFNARMRGLGLKACPRGKMAGLWRKGYKTAGREGIGD